MRDLNIHVIFKIGVEIKKKRSECIKRIKERNREKETEGQ